jgi:hypothetical protein
MPEAPPVTIAARFPVRLRPAALAFAITIAASLYYAACAMGRAVFSINSGFFGISATAHRARVAKSPEKWARNTILSPQWAVQKAGPESLLSTSFLDK